MNRSKAMEAVDAGAAEGVKNLFFVLVRNLIVEEAGAAGKFAAGVKGHVEAHRIATAEVEIIFPE